MPRTIASTSILRQLQIVFSVSSFLLIASLVASFFSIQKLITNSRLVNHTNEVLIEAENIISFIKDAETGQRGFIITTDERFLKPFLESESKIAFSYDRLSNLTIDNPLQQKNLQELKSLYSDKFDQMQKIIVMVRDPRLRPDTLTRHSEMLRGKVIMDKVRILVDLIKSEENKMLEAHLSAQNRYIAFTPILLVIAAFVSLLITGFAYHRIKKDVETRIEEQKLVEEKYKETHQRITYIESTTHKVANGDYSVRSLDSKDDELGRISKALNTMTAALETTFNEMQDKAWLQNGKIQLGNAIRGERILSRLANNLISVIATYVQSPVATIYIADEDWNFKLAGSYAVTDAPNEIVVGQGLAGQVIREKNVMLLTELPADYHKIASSLGSTQPASVILLPIVYNNDCLGLIELGMLRKPEARELEFLESNLETIAVGINAALDYIKLQNFLEETQAQSEELQAQHNELENLNSELEAQSQKLQSSEEELRVQQEELQQTNKELEERSRLLEDRNVEILKKAEELEQSTRYKSEFLANMSHELRTPLNSILLLSRLLSENNERNLSSEQIEFANVIRSSGHGLLSLIDEILDLSKIEAGKMELDYERVELKEIVDGMNLLFAPLAKEKKLDFIVKLSDDVPTVINTDKMRLEQIVKNLISNALKFTSVGSVEVRVEASPGDNTRIRFTVKDTGIGIAPEKQDLVFEAFRQADGSTKRKYGGTGLGLSISRELAKFLGGEITLRSKVGRGSEFTLLLPVSIPVQPSAAETKPEIAKQQAEPIKSVKVTERPNRYISSKIPEAIPDDRNEVADGDNVILIVEDDTFFAKSLLDYTHKKGYKGVVTVRGDEALELAIQFKPKGILLDIQLPVLSGWEVMDQLKANSKTRHIPVHIMSSHKLKNESLLKGAIDFIDKPVAIEKMHDIFQKIEYVLSKKSKKVLILEDNPMHAKALAYFLETFHINSELKSDVAEGIEALRGKNADCVILDMGIPDKSAYKTLEEVKKNPEFENLPIIIFTGKSLSMTEELKIKKYADSIIVKTAHSYQRMLDEVSLFLHLVEENSTGVAKNMKFKKLGGLNEILNNKTVLIADDDVRNIFSLTKALENFKINVITALDGKEALVRLEENPAVDVVLLDMMMPQMDGYETARRIRENKNWKNLPVIAVTAKAMTGDREKCINSGASDYITKPVDIDQLISLLRVWLFEKS
jgi:signal transduction histidine kinase/CheY-like chemotaxis protein/CHASE3 domain sensor protein